MILTRLSVKDIGTLIFYNVNPMRRKSESIESSVMSYHSLATVWNDLIAYLKLVAATKTDAGNRLTS